VLPGAEVRSGIRVAAVGAVKQISTRILLRPEKRCYPRDTARDLLVTCHASGEAFSALSGPYTCHCRVAVQTLLVSADVCV
jgi:hypothetical protein